MAVIKNSSFLGFLIEYATHLDGKNCALTASRFLISIFDVFAGKAEYDLDPEEASGIRQILHKLLPFEDDNIQSVRDRLYESGAVDAPPSSLEGFYMQKILYMAKEATRKEGQTEISAQKVLEMILRSPDKALRSILFPESVDGNASQDGPSKKGGTTASTPANHPDTSSGNKVPKRTPPPPPAAPAAPEPPAGPGSQPGSEPQAEAAPETRKEAVARLTEKVKQIHRDLSGTIFGQENAISVFTKGYFQAEMEAMTEKDRVRPRATFLFAGPPGVGKTLLAERAAALLGLPFQRFDMSEYSDRLATDSFLGSSDKYMGAKEGNVTGFVSRNPKCVLLFDEIEKSHLVVIHLFLQLLDAGRLRDGRTNKEVSFADAIIFFTTNAGRQFYEAAETTDFSTVPRKVILKALENDINPVTDTPFFPPAICSRFASGNVVMFNYISANHLTQIVKKEVLANAAKIEASFGINIRIDEPVYTALLFAEGGSADARAIKSRATAFINQELYELFRLLDAKNVDSSIGDLESISITLDLPGDNPEIMSLFEIDEKPEILLASSQKFAADCRQECPQAVFVPVQSTDAAKKAIQSRNIRFALIDLRYKSRNSGRYLNIEDVDSAARDLLWYIREHYSTLPVYLIQSEDLIISEEEKVSFLRMGVRGILPLSREMPFSDAVQDIVRQLHQQRSMDSLARANKLISFETSQSISKKGRHAEIRLFDFEMGVAVEAEDGKNVLSSVSKPDVSFDQVIGAEDAKRELRYYVEYLKNPRRFLGTGLATPKGVLLYGPPGTGKTMLAKATASESDVTFIAAEGNQFLKKYVGEGPGLVHSLFQTARKYAPSILFIDEIDVIARDRSTERSYSADDILTAFLAEMDGFKNDPSRPVFVLAATNFDASPGSKGGLDAAILRRFDRRILVDNPNRDERIRYIRMRMEGNPSIALSEEKIKNIAIRSTGMSFADLASIMDLALRSSVRDGTLRVTDEIFDDAFETYSYGEIRQWDPSRLERTARHEAGHAFLCWYGGETPSYLTIIARGSHGGYMQHDDHEDKGVYTKQELIARLRTSLGGRAAELVYYGQENGYSTGASGDLRTATKIAENILCTYGMDQSFGLSYISPEKAKSGELSVQIHERVSRILAEELQEAVRLITEHRTVIDALVEQLLVKNHLNGSEIAAICEAGK